MPDTPLRGRRGRDRRIAEWIASDFASRHAPPRPENETDFDVAAVDAEVADARRRDGEALAQPGTAVEQPPTEPARRAASAPAPPTRAGGTRVGAAPTGAAAKAPAARKGGGQRIPDLSALTPLLAATGTFASLRDRLAPTGDARRGRHVGLVAIPHGAKSYLAAALALGGAGERVVWIARDAEIGDRVAEELGAWLGDPAAVVVLEPRTALAYERSELVADETAARVAALAAWRAGSAPILVASVQALLPHTIRPHDPPAPPPPPRLGGPAPGRAPPPARRPRAPGGGGAGPGRGRSGGFCGGRVIRGGWKPRGGAIPPAAAGSSTCSRRRRRCRSGSSSSATRSTRSGCSTPR